MLDTYQRAAVENRASRIRCVACPGSGKTSTLTATVASRINTGLAHPSRVMVVTFSRSAAEEVQERINQQIVKVAARDVTVCTFHSMCYDIVRLRHRQLGFSTADLLLYTQAEADGLIKRVLATLRRAPGIKASKIEMEAYIEGTPTPFVERYLSLLREESAVDYWALPRLALQTLRALGSPWQVTDLFIDEAQDLDAIEWRIFECLNPLRSFVVGDPCQAVYEWRGAKPYEMVRTDFQGQEVQLSVNYRSKPGLVELAESVYRRGMNTGSVPHGDGIEVRDVVEFVDELDLPKRAATVNGALLARNRAMLREVSSALEAEGVEHTVMGTKTRLLEDSAVRTVTAYSLWPAYPSNPVVANTVLIAERVPEVRRMEIAARAAKEGRPIYAVALEELPQLRQFYEEVTGASLVEQVADALSRCSSLGVAIDKQKKESLMWALATFARSAPRGQQSALRFGLWLGTADEAQEAKDAKGLRLMTIHGSKGLEFDEVVLYGLDKRFRPDTEEERRLLYVAITRAKHKLIVVRPFNPGQFFEQIEACCTRAD